MRSIVPFNPKSPDGTLKVIVLGRLSRPKETEEETQENIESSYLPVDEFLKRSFDGPLEVQYLGEQISGYIVDRATMRETWRLIDTGEWDAVVCEDLRIVSRNPRHQQAFVQDCVDAEIRCICLADDLDTADENWEIMLNIGGLRHGMHVPDTRRRSKRKALYSFRKGGMVQKVKFGYRKLTREEANSGDFGPVGLREAKVPDCTPIFQAIRTLAIETGNPNKVLNWIKKEGIPTGAYVKGGWTLAILRSALCDPKLHGWRLFRRTLYHTIYKSGLKRREKNSTPEKEYVAELAHMTHEDQQSMVSALGWEIDWNQIKPKQKSPRKNVSREKSFWPGRAATCAICNKKHGMLINGNHLRCGKSMKVNGYSCWNHLQVPIELTRVKVIHWLAEQIESAPTAKEALTDAAWIAFQQCLSQRDSKKDDRQKKIQALQVQQSHVADAIAQGGQLQALLEKLKSIEEDLNSLLADEKAHEGASHELTCISSRKDIGANLEDVLMLLASTSFEFADVMRQFFPVFVIQPVQALDSGQVRPRGKLRLHLPNSESAKYQEGENVVEVQFDLFDAPVHISYLPKVVAAHKRVPRPTYRKIAEELGINYMTVKRSLSYAKLMADADVEDPYIEIFEVPQNAARWRNVG